MAPLAAQKTDTVVIRNGDILTGEIKKLHRGKLEYSTDDFGTVYIEWDKIIKLISVHYFEFELREGGKLYGKLPDTTVTLQLVIVLPTFSVDTVEMDDVVVTDVHGGGDPPGGFEFGQTALAVGECESDTVSSFRAGHGQGGGAVQASGEQYDGGIGVAHGRGSRYFETGVAAPLASWAGVVALYRECDAGAAAEWRDELRRRR